MTTGQVSRAIFVSIYPALMVGLFYYMGGWVGVLACVAMLGFIGLLVWGCSQP